MSFSIDTLNDHKIHENYQKAAKEALDCQNACNLSGVAFSFARSMQSICDYSNRYGKGTAWKNEHPIVKLYLEKMAQLNDSKQDISFLHYQQVENIAAGQYNHG